MPSRGCLVQGKDVVMMRPGRSQIPQLQSFLFQTIADFEVLHGGGAVRAEVLDEHAVLEHEAPLERQIGGAESVSGQRGLAFELVEAKWIPVAKEHTELRELRRLNHPSQRCDFALGMLNMEIEMRLERAGRLQNVVGHEQDDFRPSEADAAVLRVAGAAVLIVLQELEIERGALRHLPTDLGSMIRRAIGNHDHFIVGGGEFLLAKARQHPPQRVRPPVSRDDDAEPWRPAVAERGNGRGGRNCWGHRPRMSRRSRRLANWILSKNHLSLYPKR